MATKPGRFTVAFNGDDHLIPTLASLHEVESLFGKLSRDVVGGGRPTYLLADIGLERLSNSIRIAHQHELKFYYLLNSACMGNREFSRATNKHINLLIDNIVEAGADGVVVSMPYLLTLVKKRYPKLRVSISTFAGIDSPQKARAWEDRGADRLILSIDVNRNRTMLEKLRQTVKCELELFANAMCLFQCPFGAAHAASNGHSSSSVDTLKGFTLDYLSYQCAERRLREPSEFIRGRFIRPEDIDTYTELGIDVFKLSDRLKGSSWLIRAASAYASRRYDGNLADLISYPVFASEQERPLTNPARFVARGKHANRALLQVMQDITKCVTPVYIDNRKLDGFLAHYFRHDCLNSRCGVDCRYCETVAARAVTLDPAKHERCLAHVTQFNAALEDHRTFTPDPPIARLGMALARTLSSRKNNFGTAL
ncbi:MAG TPA: peptidase U32 family protein [Polyangiaceae bacterium]